MVEDEPEWRQIFSGLIEGSSDFNLTFMAENVAEATRAIETQSFDGALIDIGLSDGSGIALVALLARRQPRATAAICTVFEDEASVLGAIRAGAAGYILKQNATEELLVLLRHMKAGGAPLSPRVARHILNQFGEAACTGAESERGGDFTPREIEVLRSVAGGMTLRQAGTALGIAESTVRTHVKNLYSKLGVNNRGMAVLEASRRRLV